MKVKFAVSILVVVATGLLLQYCKSKPPQCPLCDRDIHAHMQVSIKVNSLPLKTCCMSCALTYQAQTKNVSIASATQFITDRDLDPRKAIYLVDSDISPCIQDAKVHKVLREPHAAFYACYDRCQPGILAFTKEADAVAFQKTHGGQIETFDQLKKYLPLGGENHDKQHH